MNILIYSNSIHGRYGYSNVFGEVARGLVNAGHMVCYFGMQDIGPPWKDSNGIIRLGLRYDSFGSDILENVLRSWNIDLLLTGMDVWIGQVQYMPALTKKLGIMLMTHVTANTYPLSPFLGTFLSQVNFIVCPSKFVFNTVKEVFSEPVFYIPHGIDPNIYRPLAEEQKQAMKEKLKIDDKEFVVLSVMRNRQNKDFPTLFNAWKMLLEKHQKLREKGMLLILSDHLEPDGIRLEILRDRVGLKDNIRFVWAKPTKELSSLEATFENDSKGFSHNANYNFSAEEMAKLYNIADCHVTCSPGESFNLPTLEAMSCGVPVIFGNHTTGLELVGESKAGLLANVKTTLTTPLISDNFYIDPASMMECLKKIYEDESFKKDCSKNGLEFAKKYRWDIVGKRWVKLMDAVEYIK